MGRHSGARQYHYSIREQKGHTLAVGKFARARVGESALHAVLIGLSQMNRLFPLEVSKIATGAFTTYRVVFGYHAGTEQFNEATAIIDIEDQGYCKVHH